MRNEVEGIYNWNLHDGPSSPQRMPQERVQIDDETWRDGMQGTQSEQQPSAELRNQYIAEASKSGYIDHLDIGFPGSGVMHRDQIVNLINSSQARGDGVTFSVAGRAGAADDARAILEIAERTGVPLEADIFWDVSKIRAEIEGWDREQMLIRTLENIRLLTREGLSVMFVPERASDTSPQELFPIVEMAADQGIDRLAIADTRGVLTPHGTINIFRATFAQVGSKYPDLKVDFHEHDDLKMGIANCLTAAQEGVDRLHATARGIGERSGNVDLEQLVVVLNVQGYRDADTTGIIPFTHLASDILNVAHQNPHEAIIGEQWPETASGVHASTYGKMGSVPIYFPFNPQEVGLQPRVRIGPMSGLANVRIFCDSIGIKDITEEKAREILDVAKSTWSLLSEERVRELVGIDKPSS